MARKRAGSIDSDDSTNARAERRAKRTQFLGTRLQGRTDSCYILASALRARALDHGCSVGAWNSSRTVAAMA